MSNKPTFAIKIREEGDFVNAYFSGLTGQELVLLGSIRVTLCDSDRSVFDAFVASMTDALDKFLVATSGEGMTVVSVSEPDDSAIGGNA